MNEIEKLSQPASHTLMNFEPDRGYVRQDSAMDTLIRPVMRHWRIALAVFCILVAAGVPLILFFVEPLYDSVGAIMVAPTQQNIVFKDVDKESAISDYQSFVNTQVDLIGSPQVLNRAADELKGKNLSIVGPDSHIFLRDALTKKWLLVESPENTELIKISMKTKTPDEAEKVVSAVIRAYMAIEASQFIKADDKKLTLAEDELGSLSEKRRQQRQVVRQMSQEFGTTALTGRQDSMLEQVKTLQTEITKVQTKEADLETQIQMLTKATEEIIPLEKVMTMRSEFLKADPSINTLSNNVAQLEQGMVVATQTMTQQNPELQRRRELLDAMKKRLKERQAEISQNFDDMLKSQSARNRDYKLREVKAELEQTTAYEGRLNSMLAKHNKETIAMGQKQIAIEDQKEKLAVIEETYNSVAQRIRELDIERKRPAQIYVAYDAASMPATDQRKKLIAANVFGAGMMGILLAVMLERVNRRIYSPEDVTRRIGVYLLGTTINSSKFDRSLLQDRIVDDFQVIRANLGLFGDEKIPHKLVITSATAGEGKTTFAINLAINMAKTGAKVLLIDGDMRKPEIGSLLNFNGDSNGVCKVLLGRCGLEESIWPVPATGLDVLLGNNDDSCDCFEVLAQPQTAQRFETICAKYDNVIIDTPPVLAVPDALLWAKMADAVVMASLAGQTAESDMQKAIERLKQINARILGAVINSVSIKSSYTYGYSSDYGYGYGYGKKYGRTKKPDGKVKNRSVLLSINDSDNDDAMTSG